MTLKETLIDYFKFLPKASLVIAKFITKYTLILLAGAVVMLFVLWLMNIQQEHIFAEYRVLYPDFFH